MARFYYYVVLADGVWHVKAEGHSVGTFRTQSDAIATATQRARGLWEQQRRPSGVRIQGRDGLWQDERTYGNDPFPPPG